MLVRGVRCTAASPQVPCGLHRAAPLGICAAGMLSLVASRGAGSLASVARLGWHLQGSLPGAAPAATHDPEDASRISSGQSASCSSATGGPTGAAAANLGPQPHAWMLLRALSTSASASFCGSAAHMMPSPSPAASSTRRVGPALHAPEYAVGLHNLRDNPGATRPVSAI